MSNVENLCVVKASGERAIFDAGKLRRSLENAGASTEVIEAIYLKLQETLYDRITTKKIYQKAYALLRAKARSSAARYRLKKAILKLGPSGYPFEKFIAALLRHQGYATKVGQIVKGYCIPHEVDVIAEREKSTLLIECKFHSDQGRKSDVKIPLYVYARFRDISKKWRKKQQAKGASLKGWIVTNTRFSEDGFTYGRCVGMHLVSWDQPANGSLKDRINLSGLYPITCLTTLSQHEVKSFLNEGVVLCKELRPDMELFETLGFSDKRKAKVLFEANEISVPNK